jgi:hypothetical protein
MILEVRILKGLQGDFSEVRILKKLVASDEWLVTGGGAREMKKALWLDGPILPPTRMFFASVWR